MEEIERCMVSKDGKVMHAHFNESIRNLVDYARDMEIPRENVVSILKEKEYFVLIYYK